MQIGIIDSDRLSWIPKKQRAGHEFCYWLHDRMLAMLIEASAINVTDAKIEFADTKEVEDFNSIPNNGVIDWLLKGRHHELGKRLVLNNCIMALYGDLLAYVSSALHSLEKRRTTVAFTLLRKPLRETMFMLAWMCADEEEFFQKFRASTVENFSAKKLSADIRRDVLKRAIAQFRVPTSAEASTIFDIVFNKKIASGLAPYFDMSTHLVTDATSVLQTEPMNFNLVFGTSSTDDDYPFIYFRLSYCLLFIMQLQAVLFGRMFELSEIKTSQDLFIGIATYDALFVPGKSTLWPTVLKALEGLATCSVCDAPINPRKAELPRFLITEQSVCRKCGSEAHFPISWMFAKAKLKLSDLENIP